MTGKRNIRNRHERRVRSNTSGPLGGRLSVLIVGVAMAFVVVIGQLVNLTIVKGPGLSARAENLHHKSVRLSGERGTITDRNGAILAKNMDVPSITADPSQVNAPRQTARALAKVLPINRRTIEKRLKSPRSHFAWIHRKADPAQAKRVMDLNLAGVYQMPESRRFYPKGSLLGHTLGFAGMDNAGLSGIERVYDQRLKGGQVTMVVQRDGHGRSVFPIGSRYMRPDHGADISLTIDEVIQYQTEAALDRAMATTHAKSGQVVVMDPNTGEILAMAVRPLFDPNRPGRYSPKDYRNRVVTDPYEPGSTLKLFVAASALEMGVVTLDEQIDCENGRMPMRGGALHDSHPHGLLSFEQILVKSSNIGSAKVAMRMGPDKLYHALRNFGFGSKTNIGLPGESAGILPPTRRWSGRSLASIAMGQELAVTPIQLATAASAVANGGKLMTPYLVRSLRDRDGTTVYSPKVVRRVISEAVATDLRHAMIGVTQRGGTAPRAAVPGYPVAGKTGTAQKADPKRGGYAKGKYISSFLGMVPASDPRLVILVVLDEAQGKYYGGTVAGPVFKEIAGQALRYLGVFPESGRTMVLAQNKASL